jgi:murein DD-endopeptidase MepM/ murein hydrolase activator NlpD
LGQPSGGGLRLGSASSSPTTTPRATASATPQAYRATATGRASPTSPRAVASVTSASGTRAAAEAGAPGVRPLGLALRVDLAPTVAASASATPTFGAGSDQPPASTAVPDGVATLGSPYFSWLRPFDADSEVRPSRYYPYGSTGHGQYLLHHGVDIGNPLGTAVRAVADGRVVFAGTDDQAQWGPETDFYGRLVVLEHDRGIGGQPLYSLYGHVSAALVQPGQFVAAGEPIAQVGMEGIALGPHLHLEVRTQAQDYGSAINPELFLEQLPGDGVIVGRLAGPRDLIQGAPVSLYAADDSGLATSWLADATAYPSDGLPDGPLGESFVFGDTAAGRYLVTCTMGRVTVSAPVTVSASSPVFVTLRAEGEG